MCGITAVLLANKEATCVVELIEGLRILQHRGQDAAGIITCGPKGRLYQCKGIGLVRDVFLPSNVTNLMGYMGVGHIRYPTAGTLSNSEVQPFYVNSPYGIVLAHNGNLVNAMELRTYLDKVAHRHVNTESDSELLLNILADNLQKTGKFRVNEEDVFTAIQSLFSQCRGGYACVGMIAGFGIIAFRDPHGIRPLIYGRRSSESFPSLHDHYFASESVALDVLGYPESHFDILPGEAVIVTPTSITRRRLISNDSSFRPCIFEYVYFARPDTIIDGISVYRARIIMGQKLATRIVSQLGEETVRSIDVVIPVPDTSRVSALEIASLLGIKYREGFMKNRYIGRTFIMPGQQVRKKSVRQKLNAMSLEFRNKIVLLVDDSIVRGTTSKEIIQMARQAGALKVYIASCAPPIRFPNVYGISMPTRSELVAFGRSAEEVGAEIGADAVVYQTLEDLVEACREYLPDKFKDGFEASVFDGDYITGDIDEKYLHELEVSTMKANEAEMNETVGLHNSFRER